MSIYKIKSVKEVLCGNSYVGRGIMIGKTADGTKAATAYFIMGRSENSRNRIFVKENSDVTIYPFDASKVKDPSLIIYSPVKVFENKLIVTNGDQTNTIYDYLNMGDKFENALRARMFEPDSPNFTPRISGILEFEEGNFDYKLSILKSADENGNACNRYTFEYSPLNGLGHFIHTYNCDGNPIPTFTGEPERIAVLDDIDEWTKEIWDNLDEKNKISIYVRYVDLKSGKYEDRLINKNI